MNRKVFLAEDGCGIQVVVTEDERAVSRHTLPWDNITGSIFYAKVINVKKEIGVFVDIGRDKPAVLRYRVGLKAGDGVVVMAERAEEEDKGASVTEAIALCGRYAVLNESGRYRFSRHLSDEAKNALAALPSPSAGLGILFRSAAGVVTAGEILEELNTLYARLLAVREGAKNVKPPLCLYRDLPMDAAKRFAYRDEEIVYGECPDLPRCGREVDADGVRLIFDKTEAMTVVDVNYHRFQGSYRDADTANYYANLAAAKRIAEEIRLRNLGGIILIDFISLRSKEYKEGLYGAFSAHLQKDHEKTTLEYIDSLSIYAVVRKRRY